MLGVALLEECLRESIEVIAIVRRNSQKLNRLPKSDRVRVIELDLDELKNFDPDRLQNSSGVALEHVDAFYHLAWGGGAWGEEYSDARLDPDYQALNIHYTLDAVRLAKKLDCKKFLFAGSQAECGVQTQPLDRNTPIAPTMAYGTAKYAAGSLASMLCRTLELDFVHMRILSVYGINDGSNTMISYAIRSYLNGERPQLTGGDQIWDYLYSDDAARCFRLLGECDNASGLYHIGAGEARRLRDYIEIIHRLTHSTVPLIFGEKPYAQNQVMYLKADIGDLRRDIDWEPRISFEEGINRIISARIKKTH